MWSAASLFAFDFMLMCSSFDALFRANRAFELCDMISCLLVCQLDSFFHVHRKLTGSIKRHADIGANSLSAQAPGRVRGLEGALHFTASTFATRFLECPLVKFRSHSQNSPRTSVDALVRVCNANRMVESSRQRLERTTNRFHPAGLRDALVSSFLT